MSSRNRDRLELSGSDCLMLAMHSQLKQLGFPGNQAQISLFLQDKASETDLAARLQALKRRWPIITGAIKRGFWPWNPYWSIHKGSEASYPRVRSYCAADGQELQRIRTELLNSGLDIQKGELIRLDLLEQQGHQGMEVIMTWSHMLMDVHGAEYFLALLGNSVPGAQSRTQAELLSGSYTERMPKGPKWKQAKQAFNKVDQLASHPPVSVYTQSQVRLQPRQDFVCKSFTEETSQAIEETAKRHGGFLNASAYYAAAGMGAFLRLLQERNISSPGYVLPVSIDLRKKGTRLPVFGNQAATLLYGFEPEQVQDFACTMDSFAHQARAAVREGLLQANICAMELSRVLPSRLYARKMRQAFKGEIASMVLANPGQSLGCLSEFMGCAVKNLVHVPIIVVPPGLGLIFYSFSGRLQLSLVYVQAMLSRAEAGYFIQRVERNLCTGRWT
ncbi:MAG: hypothetical protein ACOC3Y_00455 [Desulfohalobiaceae bacterium]